MTAVFGPDYSAIYDDLYDAKDYDAEAACLLALAAGAGASRVQSVLDLGCGTGGHAIALAKRGLSVVGVDSSRSMLDIARTKTAAADVADAIELVHSPIADCRLGREFDVAIMMFAVLGYHTTDAAVLEALSCARAHLQPGSPFLCDFWFGPAVLAQRPSERQAEIRGGTRRIARRSTPTIDMQYHVCTVDYEVCVSEADGHARTFRESHAMRFFFPEELRLLLDAASFDLIDLRAFPDTARRADESSWNAIAIARARA